MPITGEELIKKTDTFIEKTDTLVGEMSSLLKKVTTSENKKQQEETNAKRQIARDAFSKKKDYLEDVNKGVLKTNDILMQLLRKPGDRDKGGGLFGGLGDILGGIFKSNVGKILGGLLGAGVLGALLSEDFRKFLGNNLVDPLAAKINSVMNPGQSAKNAAKSWEESNKSQSATFSERALKTDPSGQLGVRHEVAGQLATEANSLQVGMSNFGAEMDWESTGGIFRSLGNIVVNTMEDIPLVGSSIKKSALILQTYKKMSDLMKKIFVRKLAQKYKRTEKQIISDIFIGEPYDIEDVLKEIQEEQLEKNLELRREIISGDKGSGSIEGGTDLEKLVIKTAEEKGIGQYSGVLLSQFQAESSGGADLIGPMGEVGIYQIMPHVAAAEGLNVPEELIALGKQFQSLQTKRRNTKEGSEEYKDLTEKMAAIQSKLVQKTKELKGKVLDERYDVTKNVQTAIGIMANNIDTSSGNIDSALQKYNAGKVGIPDGKRYAANILRNSIEGNNPASAPTVKINVDKPVSTSIDDKTIEKWMVGFKKVLESSSKSDRSTVVNLAGTKK